MVKIKIYTNSISVERFIDIEQATNLPIINVHTTLSFVDVQQLDEKTLELSFRIVVSYNPTLAHANVKGNALIAGTKKEVKKLYADYQNKKPLPPPIARRVLEHAISDLIILTRMTMLPPPVPLSPFSQTKTSKVNYAV